MELQESLTIEEQKFLKSLVEQTKTIQQKLENFAEFLSFKYKLTVEDKISEEGVIIRGNDKKNHSEAGSLTSE